MEISQEIENQINEYMAEEFKKFVLEAMTKKQLLSKIIDVPYLGKYKAYIAEASRDENDILIGGTIIFKKD